MQGTDPTQFIHLSSMMDGSYFDRMSVGEVKQNLEAHFAEVWGGIDKTNLQQRREGLRFPPRKGKTIQSSPTNGPALEEKVEAPK
jgi:hypothetical protein